jgi:hypothetical protein
MNTLHAGEIRDRSSHSQESLGPARRPPFEIRQADCLRLCGSAQGTGPAQRTTAEARIWASLTLHLPATRDRDPPGHLDGALGAGMVHVLLRSHAWHVHPQVDSIAEGPRDSSGVPIDRRRLTAATTVALPGVAARASLRVSTTPPCAE